MFTNIEDFQKFSKDQVEAATKAATLATKNLQQIASESTDFSKKSVEQGTAAVEQLMGAKSLDKAFEIQSAYAKSAYEGFVAQATKVGEIYTTFFKEAFKPLEGAFAKATAK